MPVEDQWNRVNNPLRPRDRHVLAVFAVVAVLAVAGGIVAYLLRPPPPSNAGCVVVTVASTMGGAILRNCGPAARTFCREQSNVANAAEQCVRLGYPSRPNGSA